MGRITAVVLFMCVLACSRAGPVASGKEEPAVVQDVKAPAAIQDSDVKEMLTPNIPETVPKEESAMPVKDGIEADTKPDSEKPQPQEAEVAPEVPSREARNLGSGNLANEIGGAGISHESIVEPEDTLLQKLNNKCSERDVSSCVMLKLVTYMNRLLKKSNIEVISGLHITQTASEAQVEQETQPLEHPRASMVDEESDESQLSQILANKLWTFVRTRSIKWNVLPDADVVMSTSPDEQGTLNVGMSIRTGKALEKGRGKMKQMGPMMAAVAMKFALLGGLAIKGLALLVGKALLVSKIALLLAGILWIKKLFSQQKHVTYEVVAHPHHSHSSGEHHGGGGGGGGGDSYSSGWGRSSDTEAAAHQLAYRAYSPAATQQ